MDVTPSMTAEGHNGDFYSDYWQYRALGLLWFATVLVAVAFLLVAVL